MDEETDKRIKNTGKTFIASLKQVPRKEDTKKRDKKSSQTNSVRLVLRYNGEIWTLTEK